MQAIFPLEQFLQPLANNPWTYLVFGLIGVFFGMALEVSGFGNSKKLAAQFYFKDMTVLKVMFTAIVTAMVLIFLCAGIGILDFSKVWVNHTYLWPGIVGGLIMGVGFIVGGFCPGTSLVSASTLKLDGIAYALGTLVGVWAFGDTVGLYWEWWNTSGFYGRMTWMDLLNVPAGWVVVVVVLMALFMFWGSEQLERIFGGRDLKLDPPMRKYAAGALLLGALVVLFLGQPNTEQKWAKIAPVKDTVLTERQVQIHPGELLATMADDRLRAVMFDVRPENEYNLFHIDGALRVNMDDLARLSRQLAGSTAVNTVYILISNNEQIATEAWKVMTAESVPNVYILEGGVNNWLSIFAAEEPDIQPTPAAPSGDQLAYQFPAALGARFEAAAPNPYEWKLEYTPKIKLQTKRDKSGGGCG